MEDDSLGHFFAGVWIGALFAALIVGSLVSAAAGCVR